MEIPIWILWALGVIVGVPAIVSLIAFAGIGAIFVKIFKDFQLKP